jgi:hypothetical protein
MPQCYSSNFFSKVDITLRHGLWKQIEDLVVEVIDHNKGSDDGV